MADYSYTLDLEKIFGKFRNDRYGAVLTIKHGENTFKWLPTYEDMAKLIILLGKAETINKNLGGDKNGAE